MKILIWAPHTAIWQHAYPESLVADSLSKSGDDVVFIRCDKPFQSYCVAMSAFGLVQSSDTKSKEHTCKLCAERRQLLVSRFKQVDESLSAYLDQADFQTIDNLLVNRTREEILQLTLDDISIFKVGTYEVLLQYKKHNLNFTDEEWNSCLISMRNTLMAYFAGKKILEKHKPDRVLIYNTLYSVNHIILQLAEKRNIPTYILHAGDNLYNRLSTLYICRKYPSAYRNALKEQWKTYKEIPLSKDEIEQVANHFRVLFKGEHFLAYSSGSKPNTDIRKYFNIPETNKKILVATLSSYDERFAGESAGSFEIANDLVFKDQIEWINFLLGYLRNHPEYFLIIRVHPREFPNKRDPVKSEHAGKLKEVFRTLPPNAVINWPDDNLSLYDLAKETDLFLNAWSSVGEEMSFFGIPVLIFSSKIIAYPPELNYVASSVSDYSDKIALALQVGWNPQQIIDGFRWYNLKFNHSLFHISEYFGWPAEDQKSGNTIRALWLSMLFHAYGLWKRGPVQHMKYIRRHRSQIRDLVRDNPDHDARIHDMLKLGSATKFAIFKNIPITAKETAQLKNTMSDLAKIMFDVDTSKQLYRKIVAWTNHG